MSKVTSTELKRLIMDIVTFTDDLNAKGERERVTSYNKKHFRGIKEIMDKISAHIEIQVIGEQKVVEMQDGEAVEEGWQVLKSKKLPRPAEDTDINKPDMYSVTIFQPKFVSSEEFKNTRGMQPIGERYIEGEIDLTPKAIEALKYAADNRDEYPSNVSVETIDLLDALLAKKH